jgi:N-acetylglucosamine-6-sulfatase
VFAVVRERADRDGAPNWEPVQRASVDRAQERPNIVFVYTDDQEAATFNPRYMPRTTALMADGGTSFSDAVVATPICCPSRASMLTGSYPHNSGVWMNKEGWSKLRDAQNNLGSWMQRAGYRTAWIGKFLQGYKQGVPDPSVAAPGFDDWMVSLKPKFFDYKLFVDGEKVKRGSAGRDYYTDVLTRRAVRLVREQSRQPRPLFMVLNHLAPHRGKGGKGRCSGTVAPAPRDFGTLAGEPLPRPPSFNRADTKKTAFPAARPLNGAEIEKETLRNRCRLESLAAVDRSVADVAGELERRGELENTIFVFTSDNGLLLGQHALTGKGIPYEEGLKVPLGIRVPPQLLEQPPVARVDRLVANIDLAPTLLELAGADSCLAPGNCRTLDGRSLVPLLEGRERAWPDDRAVLIEGGHRESGTCAYRGVRLENEVLLRAGRERDDGGCEPSAAPEVYDLRADPFQLENLAAAGGNEGRVAELERRLQRLERCAGTATQPGDREAPCE